jgi:hypothetical protein
MRRKKKKKRSKIIRKEQQNMKRWREEIGRRKETE